MAKLIGTILVIAVAGTLIISLPIVICFAIQSKSKKHWIPRCFCDVERRVPM